MNYITYEDVITIHDLTLQKQGGSAGIRDEGALASCLEQPLMTFSGQDLYPTIVEKAAALCYFLTENHPFIDGNKRTAFVSMEFVLVLNGYELQSGVDETEEVILRLASGQMDRDKFVTWVQDHVVAT